MSPRRDGIALIAVVLALVVLEAATAGALFLATLEATTTRTLIARARARAAAESALSAAIADWDTDATATLTVGDTFSPAIVASLDGAAMEARIEHAWAGAYIVTGRGTVPAPAAQASASAAALVHWFSPTAFSSATPAALTVGGTATVHAGAIVDGGAPPGSCPPADSLAHATFPGAAGITAAHAGAIHLAAGATLSGSPSLDLSAPATDSAAFARIGPVDIARLTLRAGRTETGTISLAPAASGTSCDTAAAANWGAPASPGHPCADYLPLVHAPGDVTVPAGAGQALLIVDGDFTLDTPAELHGLIFVLGNATIRGRIHGALRVRGAADIHGEIRRDACALWRAFARPAALARPHRAALRWRLPVF